MQRIQDPTAASSLPSVPSLTGPVGYLTEGSPGVTPATDVRAWFLNMIQEEMMSVLTRAGTTPDTTGTVLSQVAQSIPLIAGHGQCRLSVVSGTSLKLSPYNGRNIVINGAGYQIPQAGVSIANTGLSATTLYYVYLYNNAGTLTLELSATGHATDATAANYGTEIKSGDSTRTLVGMIYTNASSQFADTTAFRGCLNWFNRSAVVGTNTVLNAGAGVTAGVELSSTARVTFLSWAGRYTMADGIGGVANSTAAASSGAYIGFDITTGTGGGFGASTYIPASGVAVGIASQTDSVLSEGAHFATILVANTAGTATYTYGFRVVNEG